MSLVRDQDSTVAGDVSEREVHAQLDRILQNKVFKNSERLQRFLKFAIESVLDGTTDPLKESVLGRVVFDRGSELDPRTDSIVRVESQRLRRRLQEYYEILEQSCCLPSLSLPLILVSRRLFVSQKTQEAVGKVTARR